MLVESVFGVLGADEGDRPVSGVKARGEESPSSLVPRRNRPKTPSTCTVIRVRSVVLCDRMAVTEKCGHSLYDSLVHFDEHLFSR